MSADCPIACISCGIELPNAFPDAEVQPYEGTAFISHGHYGSTAFDSIDGNEILEIVVCDGCLRTWRERVLWRHASSDLKCVLHDTAVLGKRYHDHPAVSWNPDLDHEPHAIYLEHTEIGRFNLRDVWKYVKCPRDGDGES